MRTLRVGLVNLINELNTLARETEDAEDFEQIERVLWLLNTLLDEVVRREINRNTVKYRRALARLDAAIEATEAAIADLDATANALREAIAAARAVDRVVQVIAGIL